MPFALPVDGCLVFAVQDGWTGMRGQAGVGALLVDVADLRRPVLTCYLD